MKVQYNGETGDLVKLEKHNGKYDFVIENIEEQSMTSFMSADEKDIIFGSIGHWIENKFPVSIGYTCSNCNRTIYCCDLREPSGLPKYCDNCGTKMEGMREKTATE